MKENEVYEMNYVHSLNWMSSWYQKQKLEETNNNNTLA